MPETFPWRGMSRRRYRRLVLPTTNKTLTPLKVWAQQNNYSYTGALNKIKAHAIEGRKISGRWYVLE